jgi:hypothetical protein
VKLSPQMIHWGSVVIAAVGMLFVLNPMITTGAGSKYSFSNSMKGKALFKAVNVAPGKTGSGRVAIKNTGAQPIRIDLTQDQVSTGLMSSALQLRVYDTTSRRCIYPQRKTGACTAWGPWTAGTKLRRTPVLSKRGKSLWPRGESHALLVSWQLANTSPNSDQQRTAQFRLLWRGRT